VELLFGDPPFIRPEKAFHAYSLAQMPVYGLRQEVTQTNVDLVGTLFDNWGSGG